MEEKVWQGKDPLPPRRLFDPKEKAEDERKKNESVERERELEKLLNEKSLIDDLKSLGISPSSSSSSSIRPPRIGERKPDCVGNDVDKEWSKRERRRFDLSSMYTDEENQRIAKFQVYVDENARIARENKAIDEANRRRNEREEKEREFEDAKREYWRRYHEEKRNEDGGIPLPPQLDAKDIAREEKAKIRRSANREAKHWRMIHKKVLARSVDHLLDIQLIDTRKNM